MILDVFYNGCIAIMCPISMLTHVSELPMSEMKALLFETATIYSEFY